MKRIAILLAILLTGTGARAQENAGGKRLESNIQIGTGLFAETGQWGREEFPGAVLRLSYGLDVWLSEKWSVMPGAGIRAQMGQINHIGWVGGDPDGMSMADLFCQARYHFDADGTKMVVGFGPQLSFMTSTDRYYVDADPGDPLNHKEKFKRCDIALQPSVVFQTGKHFQWGFEASLGLRNMMRQYPEYNRTGSIHLINVMVTCGWRF